MYTVTLGSLNLPDDYTLEAITGTVEVDFTCLYLPGSVPSGAWYPGADGDPVCVEPLGPDFSGGFWDDVAAILKLIWEWIQYGICEIVLWLKRIWFKLGRWASGVVVDIGGLLADLTVTVMNWPITVFLFDILLFVAWLPSRFLSLLMKILSPIHWAWDFSRTIIPSVFDSIANPTAVDPLELGDLQGGFDFINGIIDDTPLVVLFPLVNAILWFVFIVWAIRQFSTSNE